MNAQVKVSEFMSRRSSVHIILNNELNKIFAYPQNDVREVAKIMKDIKIEYMQVLSNPWNRKLVGIIELNKISNYLND